MGRNPVGTGKRGGEGSYMLKAFIVKVVIG